MPNNPVYISQAFTGPSTTNSLGKAFFESANPPVTVGDNGSIAAGFGDSPTGRATLALRRALLNPEQRRRATLDAIAYGLGLGVTTHLDQGAFQKTDTPADGAAHEDNYTMQFPFLELHREGKLDARVQINFLHMETEDALPGAAPAAAERVPVLRRRHAEHGRDRRVRRAGTRPALARGEPPGAQARWRGEVHSLSTTDFMTEISGWETVNAEFPITDLRWVVAHVPRITQEWIDRLKALGGGLSLTGWQYLAGNLPTTPPLTPARRSGSSSTTASPRG